ncbi:MAG TPA: S41 family peptidase [Saprospiraceae bacterium]|nr:S41 family peptidase [Saprospiraceae bacterium]
MRPFIIITLFVLSFISPSFAQSTTGNAKVLFDEFWTFVDKNYIYFDAKKVDWDAVYQKYSPGINAQTTEDELFAIMDAAVVELKDAHSLLVKPKKVGTQYDFRSGYDIHFDPNLIKSKYIKDSLGQEGNLYWAMLDGNIGYIYLPKFNDFQAFEKVLRLMKIAKVNKLIIDVRNNGGGDSNPVPRLLGTIVQQKTLLGSYVEKIGPGHDDIVKPIPMYAHPRPDFHFDIPIAVLINRGCYSATTYFAAMIKSLPNVTLVGQITGGGAGGHLGYQLSNGWQIRVSVSDFLDKNGQSTEVGVRPDVSITNTLDDIKNGRDIMLEKAIAY